jgi:CRISPR-associated protein Csd1
VLLQSLHKYAVDRDLLARLPFQVRTVHLLLPLNADGSPRGRGFVPLTTPVTVAGKTRDQPGQRYILPRFPGEKNNTRAQYLADPLRVVLGLEKDSSGALPVDFGERVPDAVQQHRMFWRWIDEAHERAVVDDGSADARLSALREFRTNHMATVRGWVSLWTNPTSRRPKPEIVAMLEGAGKYRLSDGDVVGFEIDGVPVCVCKNWETLTAQIASTPLWADWRAEFHRRFADEVGDEHIGVDQASLCMISETPGRRVAAIHKPEVKVPGTPPKGAAFFSIGSDAFRSFGQSTAATASVSIDAAAGYALALEELLASDDNRLTIGNVTFLFWAERNQQFASANARLMRSAKPEQVADFLKSPFAGVDRPKIKQDMFLSVALSANGGRIMVRDWLRVPLDEVTERLAQWFRDLDIAALGDGETGADRGGPCSLFHLADALVRKSDELDRVSAAIGTLYQAAIAGIAPPVRLLAPLLTKFRSALVTDSKAKRTYPFSQSRFALLKLILLRNTHKGGFMPAPYLCETDDEAYNLGRLLCVLAALQDAAHDYKLTGPGVVERYYSSASTAPANVFGVLWKLHIHHLRKLEQSEKGRRAAGRIRNLLSDIAALFPPGGANQPPRFPASLSLEAQGRFALGFYQQHAADRKAIREAQARNTNNAVEQTATPTE